MCFVLSRILIRKEGERRAAFPRRHIERILFVQRGTLEHIIFRLKRSSYWGGKGIEDETMRARERTKWNSSLESLFPLHNSLNKCGFIFVSLLAFSDWKCDFWQYLHRLSPPPFTHTPVTALCHSLEKIRGLWYFLQEDIHWQDSLQSWSEGWLHGKLETDAGHFC